VSDPTTQRGDPSRGLDTPESPATTRNAQCLANLVMIFAGGNVLRSAPDEMGLRSSDRQFWASPAAAAPARSISCNVNAIRLRSRSRGTHTTAHNSAQIIHRRGARLPSRPLVPSFPDTGDHTNDENHVISPWHFDARVGRARIRSQGGHRRATKTSSPDRHMIPRLQNSGACTARRRPSKARRRWDCQAYNTGPRSVQPGS